MFGKDGSQSITPTQFKDPKNFQDGILDIDGKFDFDKSKALVVKMVALNNLELTISSTVQMFYRG
jgi:hypothetical protein